MVSAPNEREFSQLLTRLDRLLFQPHGDPDAGPLAGRKLQVHTDWGRDKHAEPASTS